MNARVGIDTGGTFTDFVFLQPDGRMEVSKLPSTPDDPSRALVEGIASASLEPGFDIVHGTTVATNALLERNGAKTALITTQGCRDVLEIARQTRDRLYDLCPAPRIPLIPRELRFEVPERLDWRGDLVTPLDVSALREFLDRMEAAEVSSVAVCFLFSFLNPTHEREAGRIARERGFTVSLSHEIAPEFREYERTSTVCANAYVAPVMAAYLGKVQERAQALGAARFSVMQSSGGTLRASEAAAGAVKTVLSGPAGGLVAAVRIAEQAGIRRIMTLDMGGTSTDVALVDGQPVTMRTGEVAGLPLLTPMLDIHTVGAGGGSIARVDSAGGLRVGPQSAGANPGPVAYGIGEELAVTDANILLGRLPAGTLLAGSCPLDECRVRDRFNRLAKVLKVTPEEAADGVIKVVNAHMARALRHISVERGHDPADYTLVPFGGAGPLHACALAESLGISSILIPRYPGAFSALGLALADVKREYAQTLLLPAEPASEHALALTIQALRQRAGRELAEEEIAADARLFNPFLEAQYCGQSYGIRIPFSKSMHAAARSFHRAHKSRYGHCDPTQPVEIVTVGIEAIGRTSVHLPPSPTGFANAGLATAAIWHVGRSVTCPVYQRASIKPGDSIDGPAIVTQLDCTTVIDSGWRATADPFANLILRPSVS